MIHDYLDDRPPRVVTELTNPITHRKVKLTTPVEIADKEDLYVVLDLFYDYCQNAWKDGQKDPAWIGDLRGWLKPSAS